ncbi:NUMOD3 motif (2 copies) [Isoptericola dokdonensis DS-3]|uniref:NUMOD3 motif (2 copies) n=1 Tax=Isoptericola dokdonensis DS-3 TaxID=1300344 RepID=A0A161HTC5_9MICO|nr:NUMOD3 motif (2 copies) [Isoptericola dokdonensis DS-3]
MATQLPGRQRPVGIIYGIRLKDSNEYRYIGLTTWSSSRRLRRHLSNARAGRKTPYYDWLRKHQEDVVVDQLYTERESLTRLGEAEILWIAALRAEGHRLLNLSAGGLGPTGVVWTDEMREAARQRSTGRKGVSRPGPLGPFYGMQHTPEQRAKWSRDRKGTFVGPANPNYGKFGEDHPSFGHTMSPESRAVLSEMRRGERNPNFGKKASPETRAKMSAAQKGVPKPSSARSAHTRYHTNQGRTSPTCKFCISDAQSN